MENIEREEYKRKINLYKKLGAEDFQKVVFAVERIKFKVLKKVCPNFLKHYEKYCEKSRKKQLRNAHTEEEVRSINRYINFLILETRKEYNSEQNRNYHMNPNDSEDILKYLNWNKSVHKEGLIKDLVLIPIVATASVVVTPWLTPLLAYEIVSAFINFECINIQNYNICRYKLVEDKIKQREERKVKKNIEEYGDIARVISDKLETSEKLPTMSEIIDSFTTKEQAEKFKKIITKELQGRNSEKEKINIKGAKQCQY